MSLDLHYIGVDIVTEIVSRNEQQFGSSRIKFLQRDITKDPLPECDLILCRDCLVHLSFGDIFATLENFRRPRAKYPLTTTFADNAANTDIQTGDWRELKRNAPVSFPPPLEAIDEKWGGGLYLDKRLALWSLKEI